METVFLSLSKNDFQDLIAETVSACLKHNRPPAAEPKEADELLTVQDAAKLLSLTVPTVYGLIHKGELPVMKRSKRCYFSKVDLFNYLKQGRKKTNAETAIEAEQYLTNKKGGNYGK